MRSDDPDARLMILVGQGDLSAFHALVDKYQGPLTNFLYRLVLNHGEAEELAQDVFLKVYRAAPRYRADARFSTWFYRIATNAGLNALKAKRRKPTESIDAMEGRRAEAVMATEGGRPDTELERQEIVQAVDRAIRGLPERQRIAVVLHRFEGLSYEEIATILSASVDAVDAMLRRAKAGLRDALAAFRLGP